VTTLTSHPKLKHILFMLKFALAEAGNAAVF